MKSLFEENSNKTKEKRSKSEADYRDLKADYSREQLKKQISDIFLINNNEDQKEIKTRIKDNSNFIILNEFKIAELLEQEIFNYSNENSKDKKYREKSLKILNRLRGKSNFLIRNSLRNQQIDIVKLVYEDQMILSSIGNTNIESTKMKDVILDERNKPILNQTKFASNKIPKIPFSNNIPHKKLNDSEKNYNNENKNNDYCDIGNDFHQSNNIMKKIDQIVINQNCDLNFYDPYGTKDFDYENYFREQIEIKGTTKDLEERIENHNEKNIEQIRLNKNYSENKMENEKTEHNYLADENKIYFKDNKINSDSLFENTNVNQQILEDNAKIQNVNKNNVITNLISDNSIPISENNYLKRNELYSEVNQLKKNDYDEKNIENREIKIPNKELILEDNDNYYINNLTNKSREKSIDIINNNVKNENSHLSASFNQKNVPNTVNLLKESKNENNESYNNKLDINKSINLTENKKASRLELSTNKREFTTNKVIEKEFKIEDKETSLKNNSIEKNYIKKNSSNIIFKNSDNLKKNNHNYYELRKENIEKDIELTIAKNRIISLEKGLEKLKKQKESIQIKTFDEIKKKELEIIRMNNVSKENIDLKKEICQLKSKCEIYKNLNKELIIQVNQMNIDFNKKVLFFLYKR